MFKDIEKCPLISIIIPVYNTEKYLPKCLDSVINQTYKNLEIICVDDGSTDTSLNILNSYSKADNRIKVISQTNSGASMARNSALDIAQGEYIMFVDSDDWVELDIIEILFSATMENDADVVICDYFSERINISKPKNIFNKDIVFEKIDVKNKLYRRMIGLMGEELKNPEKADALSSSCARLYKRGCIFDYNVRFYDIRKIGTYEDGIFNLNIFENVNKAIYIHKQLYHYCRYNEQSVTSKYSENLQELHENLHEYLKNYIIEKKLSNKYICALNNRIAMELVGYGLNIMDAKERHTQKIKRIKRIINEDKYHYAFKQLEFKYLPIHWKIFYGCAKYKFATGVYILLNCMNFIRKR